MAAGHKDPGALLTIGELSQELGIAQHILRYWESRFPQLRPMQRAGNRRYYRQADVDLARRIQRLLNEEGYTVRGVQKLLAGKDLPEATPPSEPVHVAIAEAAPPAARERGIDLSRLTALRNRLADALDL